AFGFRNFTPNLAAMGFGDGSVGADAELAGNVEQRPDALVGDVMSFRFSDFWQGDAQLGKAGFNRHRSLLLACAIRAACRPRRPRKCDLQAGRVAARALTLQYL